jgi:hypothetical protein
MSIEPPNWDLCRLSYEGWLRFFFERRLLGHGESFDDTFCPGYDPFWRASEPALMVRYVCQLCDDFRDIGGRYSLRHLNQGIWAMFSCPFELQACLWDQSVPLPDRLRCIAAMRRPYIDFVAGHPAPVMENCFQMWWDLVLGSFWKREGFGSDPAQLSVQSKALLDTAFETLCAILEVPDERCQEYALHGLGHLHHPQVASIVQRFIEVHRSELEPGELAWLEQCRDGTVM